MLKPFLPFVLSSKLGISEWFVYTVFSLKANARIIEGSDKL